MEAHLAEVREMQDGELIGGGYASYSPAQFRADEIKWREQMAAEGKLKPGYATKRVSVH
jgi:hypothetical protein